MLYRKTKLDNFALENPDLFNLIQYTFVSSMSVKNLFENKILMSTVDYEHYDFHEIVENGPYYTPGCSFDLKIDYDVHSQDYTVTIKNIKCYYKEGFKELYKPEVRLHLFCIGYEVDTEDKCMSLPITTNNTQESSNNDEIKWHLSHKYYDKKDFSLSSYALIKYKNGYEK